jgi:tRNA A-37 threonylcarbamoyl transferase component Bud32
LGLNDLEKARKGFEQSLQTMLDKHLKPLGLDALVGLAHLQARSGQIDQALELLALVQNHASSSFEIREKALVLWEELVAELPAAIIAKAEARGKALDLFAVVKSLLANGDYADHRPTADDFGQRLTARRYKIGELLAEGGHGQVYRGQYRSTGQPVVIKQLKPELQGQEELVARFLRESETLSRLNHPNIVRLVDSFEENGRHHIVMEFVPGGSLRDLLEQEGQLSQQQSLDIALELADALSRAHHLGILHRDLKPGNVLLAADNTPRLTDFGLVRLTQEDAKITTTGSIMGSPAYMSPEALLGQKLNSRSDIWSFGVLLYEMLAGKRPFVAEPLTALLTAILNDPVPEIEQFCPEINPALSDLLAQMLNKNHGDRPANMRQVGATLEEIRKRVS